MGNSAGTIYFGQVHETPLGNLWLACSEKGLVAVEWDSSREKAIANLTRRLKAPLDENPRRLALAASQLREYLDGKRKQFNIQIDWSLLRPFQREVLLATFTIPYGQTTTYGELAQQLGRSRAVRAVGVLKQLIPCRW